MNAASQEATLVVGAGPTGLLLAAELARHGAPVRIVDRRRHASAESRALAVHARALELLDSIGLADELVACGQRVRAFSIWDVRRRLARFEFRNLDSAFPFLLDVPQSATEAVLRGHLTRLGVEVEGSTEVLRVLARDDSVEVTARGPDGDTTIIRAPYVVGCDGAHSTVRDELGLRFDGHDYANDWLLADVALDWNRAPDEVYIVLNAAGRAAVFMPLPAGRWRVVLYFAGDLAENLPPTLDEVAELVSRRVPGVGVSDPSWLAAFRTTRRSAAACRRGRALLAGDAVHVHSPAGGQGLNTGLLEAQNLGWKLAAVATGAASADLLDSYEAERAPVAREVLELSHNLVRLSALARPWQRAARNILLPLVTRHPRVRARAVQRISQLYVDHRSSPLTVADGKPHAYAGPGCSRETGRRMPGGSAVGGRCGCTRYSAGPGTRSSWSIPPPGRRSRPGSTATLRRSGRC